MPARADRLTAGAVCLLLMWCCLVSAQEGAGPGQPGGGDKPPHNPPQTASAKVEESQPVLYYLESEQGKLEAVPGFTLKEFQELYKLKKQLAGRGQPPPFVLQSMLITGTAGARRANLTVELKILAREDGWVRVPLGFERAFLREPAKYQGPGEGFVHFEDGGQGHVGWIRSPARGQHELRLNMLVPLADVGNKTLLKLLLPRATISQLKLRVPIPKAQGNLSGGAELSASPGDNQGSTEFTVLGLGGDFELTWHRPGSQPLEQPTVLEAEGIVLARIDPRGIDAEATLKVHGSGAPFDRFRIRLPPGAHLVSGVPAGSNGYSVAPVKNAGGGAAEEGLVEVRLSEEKSGPVEVRLSTRRPHDPGNPQQWCELAGFEVIGAARQWGRVDVAADSDWQVRWGESLGVRQVERLPLEDVVAGFNYHAQPYSLTARLVPKKTRISVEPEYRLLIGADRVHLTATLKYTIRGARAFQVKVVLPAGWESEEVQPARLVAIDGITLTADNVLSIPLLQPSTREMELQISAQWPIPEGSSSLVLPLPRPQADWLGPAAVVVVPADNVELTPNHELMEGFLIRQPVGPPLDLPLRQQPPLSYRAEAAEAVFAADFRVHDRKIAVDATSQISLDQQACQVQQTLAYTIDYEPADYLTVEVPRSLAESGQLRFQYDGQPLTGVPLPGAADRQETSGPVRMRIDLPQACIGACELKVQYRLRLDELAAGVTRLVHREPIVLPLPLVMPGEGSLSSNRLYVTTPADIKVSLPDDARPSAGDPRSATARPVWEEAVQRSRSSAGYSHVSPNGQPPAMQLSANRPTAQVKLKVELDQKEGTTVVQRAWVQTWLIPSARRDRAVFSLTSDQKELALRVPAGTAMDRVQVLLDGRPVAQRPDAQGRLIIPLAEDTNQDRHCLELRSDCPRERHRPGRLSIELPRLEGNVRVDWLYWQLLVPWNEHVMAAPSDLTSEFTWRWDGYFWGRTPLLNQSELEDWVGLKGPADGSPKQFSPRGVNCYLFSSMGNVAGCELRTAWRSWILLSASGAALVAGLLLIYVRLSRHPATLFAVAVVLLSVGMAYPEPMLLLAQAASLGLGLALLAGLLERSVARRRRATALLELPSAVLEKASTRTHYPAYSQGQVPHLPDAMAAGTHSSTQTSPALVPRSIPDSNA